MTGLRPGDAVRLIMTKWGGRPHWEFAGVLLGADEHGQWVGFPAGTRHQRPGAEFVSEVPSVTLVPSEGAFLATFYTTPGIWIHTYVDMTTVPEWDGAVLRAVDLDLDVIRGATGRIWVDDEDEFAEHRTSLGYPAEIVALALSTCQRIHDAVRESAPPFDGAADAWLAAVPPPAESA